MEIELALKGCVSIDRSIVHILKNGSDLVTYRKSHLVPVPPYSST